jgi:acetone carboxylase gamma subunit
MHWTEANRVFCPDCGFVFGDRALNGSLQIVLPRNMQSVCKHLTDRTSLKLDCPRLAEAEASAPGK